VFSILFEEKSMVVFSISMLFIQLEPDEEDVEEEKRP
jgi:hypothetical protein